MDDWAEKLLNINGIARDETVLQSALAEFAERYDFSGYAFVNLNPDQSYAWSNYHQEWQGRYHQENLKSLDPVMRQARMMRKAFAWSGEGGTGTYSTEERRFFADASDYEIRSGISIPVATPNGAISMLTFASAKPKLILDRDIDVLTAASAVAQLHTRIEQLRVIPSIEDQYYLDPKETTYLKWVALGKTNDEIAELEKVKPGSVRIKLDGVKKRFGIYNKYQLLTIAIRRGLI